MNYRPDIDGLRAIAILLVLIYHGGLSLFPSGFVGVDVFFVISGFLITSIIHNSLNSGNFSFIDFYNRRLWRLQPAFVCVIFLTTVLTAIFFLPDDLVQYSRSARKTSLFLSNLFFNQTTTGYFSPDTHQLPLLHTWSLSIEWQCYLLLPIAMYCLHRMFSKRKIIFVVFILTFIFLFLALYNSQNAPAQTYYQFSSRIFEFLIGACVALMPLSSTSDASALSSMKHFLLNGIALVAVVTIFYIASRDHILLGYPDWYAFAVCVATGVLIAFGRFYPGIHCVAILSCRPLVFIGLLSYSLYLWHWVIFSIIRYQSIDETSSVLLFAYSATFLSGYLSWRCIEKPSRRLKQVPFRYTFASLLLLPVLFTHAASYLIKNHSGFPQRFDQELVTIYQELERYASERRPLCISKHHTDDEQQCTIGAADAKNKKALMIGDSFSNHYWGFMDTLGRAAGVSILAQGTSSCITLPGVDLFDWWHFKDKIYQECHDQTARYYRMIQENHYDYVIIGQVWGNYLSTSLINQEGDDRSMELAKQRFSIALDKALQQIVASGAKPVLIKSTATTNGNVHDCFFKHVKLRQPYDSSQCTFPIQLSENERWIYGLFAEMKVKYPQLILIDPKKVQCKNGECNAGLNGIPVFRDEGHITDYASYQFGALYLKEFGNPLMSS
ncbi:acyltransferase family protein [Legionella shakespearei]|uniref:O-acetyltransferase n=1 Tax=Legionella shakespearei DSM 23087 TaxID=1122169 RepID=A0A0W0YQQ7_9GAMM|nr:acyltransferase family protein [Legionella shakespearei]KTD59156.1 O-acetyltransferase [Legionella shakespearei DSM 23087]